MHPAELTRRALLGSAAAAVVLTVLPATATPDDLAAAMEELFAGREIRPGRVTLKLPRLAENGNSVSLAVEVPDSPMSEADHVRALYVFAEKNPLPNVARFFLGPHCGAAKVATRIRLADTQTVTAVAEMSDGTLWSAGAEVVVTLAACIDLS